MTAPSSAPVPRRPTLPRRITGALALLLAAGACGRADDAAATDSALSRDLALAAGAGAPAARRDSLAFADTAIATRAVATRPVTPAAAPAPRATAPRTPRPAPSEVASAAAPTTVAPTTAAPTATAPAPAAPTAAPAAAPTTTPASTETPGPRDSGAPAAGTAAAAGAGHVYPAGTNMVLTTAQPICSVSNKAGDRFVGTLKDAVTTPDGGTLPAGTDVVLELSSVILGPAGRGRVELFARGISIGGFIKPIDAEVAWVDAMLEKRALRGPPGSRSDASKVGHGAMAGAILGRVFGGGGAKGAVVGAAAGAAAGAAGARSDAQYEGCVPKGIMVRMRLTGPLVVGA